MINGVKCVIVVAPAVLVAPSVVGTCSKFPPCFRWCSGSPFKVGISDKVNPAKVRCYGPGLDSKNVKANKPATFTVDATEAGQAPLDVTYTTPDGKTHLYKYSTEPENTLDCHKNITCVILCSVICVQPKLTSLTSLFSLYPKGHINP